VEVHEERIRPATDLRFAGDSDGIAEWLCACPFRPQNCRCRKAVTIDLVGTLRLIHDLDQSRHAKRVEKLANDLVHFGGRQPIVIVRKCPAASEIESKAAASGDKHIAAEIALTSGSGVER